MLFVNSNSKVFEKSVRFNVRGKKKVTGDVGGSEGLLQVQLTYVLFRMISVTRGLNGELSTKIGFLRPGDIDGAKKFQPQ